jgi:hypothetical protein
MVAVGQPVRTAGEFLVRVAVQGLEQAKLAGILRR